MKQFAIVCLVACSLSPFAARASEKSLLPSAEIGGRHLVLNGEATRTVWGFEIYKVRLYLHRVMRTAEAVFRSQEHPKRIEIKMVRAVDENRFSSTVQDSIDSNFSAEEKKKFSRQLAEFLHCFDGGTDLEPDNVITIDYAPPDGTVVKLDGRILHTIPGADFYHALLRLWIGKPLQRSIRTGLIGEAG